MGLGRDVPALPTLVYFWRFYAVRTNGGLTPFGIGGFMSSEPTADLRPLGPKVFVRRTPCTARLSKSKRYPPCFNARS